MVGFYQAWDMFLAHEVGTKEDESIWRAGDVSNRPALAQGSTTSCGRAGNSNGERVVLREVTGQQLSHRGGQPH